MRNSKYFAALILLVISLLQGCSPLTDTKEKKLEEPQETDSIVSRNAFQILEFLEQVELADTNGLQEMYRRSMNEADAGAPALAIGISDALLIHWAALDPASLTNHLLKDPRCFHLRLGYPILQILVMEDARGLLELCNRDGLYEVAAIAARYESPYSEQFDALGRSRLASNISKIKEIEYLTQKDPEEALERIREEYTNNEEIYEISHLLKQVSVQLPIEAGQVAVSLIKEHPDRASHFKDMIGDWAKQQPYVAMEAIDSINSYEALDILLQSALIAWSGREPEAALVFATKNIAAQGIRQKIVTEILRDWMERDSEAAANYAFNLPQNEVSRLDQVFEPWIHQDPERAMNAIAQNLISNHALAIESTYHQRLIRRWVESDLSAATYWACSLEPGRVRNHYLLELSRHYSDNLPEAAKLVDMISESWAREAACESMLKAWAELDPGAALQWLNTQKPEHRSPKLEAGIFEVWVERDPASAAKDLPKRGELYNEDLIESVAGKYYSIKPEEAKQWVQSLPLPNQRNANAGISDMITYSIGAESAAKFLATLEKDAVDFWAYNPVARVWGQRDPEAALNWALSLDSGKNRHQSISITLRGYLDREPNKVEAWVETLEPGSEAHDAAVYSCSLHFDDIEPLKALHYASQTTRPSTLDLSFGTIFWDESKQRRQELLDQAVQSGNFTELQLDLVRKYVR